MSFPYNKVLVTGGTSGIGPELAQHLAEEGNHVITTGRRQDRLDALVGKFGASNITPSSNLTSPMSTVSPILVKSTCGRGSPIQAHFSDLFTLLA